MRKISKIKRAVALIILGLTFVGPLFGAPKWSAMRHDPVAAKSVSKVGDTEVLTLPSVILLNLSQTEKVEVFTILGRLVCEETLPPGSYEFIVEAHGVYIVKIGNVTCKVAI